ncbi:hypothetical protein R1flu_018011 [Riccia fluitans]|uniref:Reverse transcriptase zinc-binding domain-containing protein n=1 Tax=Riccia fluitans TaxID=41844 RepID=A0ABD1ZEL2_9MARC
MNSESKPKTALVSWNCINKTKSNGGLKVRPFQRVSEVLKMRYVGRLMDGVKSDWTNMMCFFIKQQMQRRSYNKEVQYWTAEEGLLLLPPFSTPQSETAKNFIQSWFKFRKYLTLDGNHLILPGNLTLKQLRQLLARYRAESPFNDRIIFPLLKCIGVSALTNLIGSSGNWINVASTLRTLGVRLNQVQYEEIDAFQYWLHTVQLGPQRLECSPSWRWKSTKGSWPGWIHPSSFWHKLLEAEELPDDLTSKWPTGVYELTWSSRWQKLWSTGGTPRVKLWTWKLLRRTFFTSERAAKMKVVDDVCCRCKEERETAPHLFFECRHSRTLWRQLQEAATEANVTFQIPQGHLQIIDKAIKSKQSGSPLIYILHNVTKAIWNDRN